MQSPKSPVYNAGYRSISSVLVSPWAFVPSIVCGASARVEGIKVLKTAREETNALVHDIERNEGNAIVAVERKY